MKALHGKSGGVPRARTAVLVLDTITDLAFPDGRKLLRPATKAASSIASFILRARQAGFAVIYINDHVGAWRADVGQLLERCMSPRSLGRELVAKITPRPDDLFLFKPKHSAFFETSLDTLLEKIGAERLVLTGFSAHQCVLFTATDAHVREYELWVPSDCVAAPEIEQTQFALRYVKDVLGADTRPALRRRRRRS